MSNHPIFKFANLENPLMDSQSSLYNLISLFYLSISSILNSTTAGTVVAATVAVVRGDVVVVVVVVDSDCNDFGGSKGSETD